MKKEKGSITLFVLIACMFMIIILLMINIGVTNKSRNQEKQLGQIVEEYSVNKTDIDSEYENVANASDNSYITSEDVIELINKMKLEMYPVGSIYISTNSTNPSEFLGGEWESYGEGRTIVGVDSSDSDFSTVKATGGEKTHKLTTAELPSHAHTFSAITNSTGAHAHTVSATAASAGAHTHTVSATAASAGAHAHTITATAASTGAHVHTITATAASAGAHTHGTGNSSLEHFFVMQGSGVTRRRVYGGSGSILGYTWTTDSTARYDAMGGRTATSSAGEHTHPVSGTAASAGAHTHKITATAASAGAHTHTVSGTAASAGAHTHTVSGTAASAGAHTHTVSGTTSSSGSGSAHNNMQPYIVTYMWERVK